MNNETLIKMKAMRLHGMHRHFQSLLEQKQNEQLKLNQGVIDERIRKLKGQ